MISDLMKKHGLKSLGISYANGGACAWSGEVSDKGYVQIMPPEPGVFWGATPDEAVRLVAAARTPQESVEEQS